MAKKEHAEWEQDATPKSLDKLGWLIISEQNYYTKPRKLTLDKDDDSWLDLCATSFNPEIWKRKTLPPVRVEKQLKIPYIVWDKAKRYFVREDILVGYVAPKGTVTDAGDWDPTSDKVTKSAQFLADHIVRIVNPYHNTGTTDSHQATNWKSDAEKSIEDYSPDIEWSFRATPHWIHRSLLVPYYLTNSGASRAEILIGYVGGAGH